jgi:hypothetical protein
VAALRNIPGIWDRLQPLRHQAEARIQAEGGLYVGNEFLNTLYIHTCWLALGIKLHEQLIKLYN